MSNNKLAIVTQWLDESRPSFEEMNLNKLDFSKEKEFMIQAFQNNPYLLGMEPNSVRNILINCALTGITLNPVMKFGYPVPRKGKLCLDVSYMGMIKIVTDTGSVKSMKAGIVYEKEHFDIELGSGGYVTHKPYFGLGEKGRRLGCYSVAVLNDGSHHIHWMYEEEIQAIMKRSESVKSGKQSPWNSDYAEMSKKTTIKQHFKYLPKSERAQMAAQAIEFDNENNGIDFSKEQKDNKTNTVNIDVLDPSNTAHAESWRKLSGIFETFLEDESLPNVLQDGTFDVLAQYNAIREKYETGQLQIEFAAKMFEWMNHQLTGIKNQQQSEF